MKSHHWSCCNVKYISMMCILRYYMFSVISVLNCDPHLNDNKELIHELNKTNGLFKFVRIMREKFQEAVAQGTILSLASYQAYCMPEKWYPINNEGWLHLRDTHSNNQEPKKKLFYSTYQHTCGIYLTHFVHY